MLPTPSTSHVSFATIYEPAEDSFLLLDTLSSTTESAWLQSRFSTTSFSSSPTPLLLEVGPGSGVVLAFLSAHCAAIFGRPDLLSVGVDVNPDACRATAETVVRALREEGARGVVFLGCVRGDLCGCLLVGKGVVDVLVFNPPYVPTESVPDSTSDATMHDGLEGDAFKRDSRLLELSYAGGKDGMETTDRLLAQIPEVLSRRGLAYVLFCRQNRPEEVKQRIRGWHGGSDEEGRNWKWCAETVGESGKRAGWEKLEIVRIWRETT